jgi:hypothetical protein
VLADSYEVLGAPKLNEAVKAREAVLESSQDFDDIAKNIRALARMYGKQSDVRSSALHERGAW